MTPSIRQTKGVKTPAVIRVFLGILFVMTGIVKITVPELGAAFRGQIDAAGLPLPDLTEAVVPIAEIVVGAAMLVGFYARLGGLAIIGMMAVATYVHLTVGDPALFPMQPVEPIVPLVTIALSALVVARGAGAWSQDLNHSV
jgi:putative oxidoreductase